MCKLGMMLTDTADLTSCRLTPIPTHSMITRSQLTSHRLVELQFTTRKLPELQLATRKLLGSHSTDTHLAGHIFESLTY